MGSLYENIMQLCADNRITGYRLCKDIGLTPSILTDLKMGRKQGLSAKNADKIAAYFHVSVGYLLGSEEAPIQEDEEMEEYIQMLKTRPECRMLFQLSKNANKEDVEAAVRIIEALRNK